MIELDPPRLAKLLRWAGIAKQTKPLIDPVALVLNEDYAITAQLDSSETVGSIVRLNKSYFTTYGEGKVVFPVAELLRMLTKAFKNEKTLKVEVTEDKLILSGSTEKYSTLIPSDAGVRLIKSNIVYTEPVGYVPEDLKPTVGYLVDLDRLKLGIAGAELYKFEYSDDKLVMGISESTMSYERKLAFQNKHGSGEGTVYVDAKAFDKIIKVLTGPGWILFVKDGPVLLTQVTNDYALTYLMAPQEV